MPCFKLKEGEVPKWSSCRYTMAYVGIFGFLFVYALRFNLSVAIVCMVMPITTNDTTIATTPSPTGGPTTVFPGVGLTVLPTGSVAPVIVLDEDQCGALATSSGNVSEGRNKPEFYWDRPLQGYILGSFFYGYIITQVPGGWLSGYFGGKRVFGAGMLLTALSTILLPVCARAHVGLVIFMRVLSGLGTGVVFPAMHSLWAKWAPPLERTKLISFTYAGTMLGNILAFFLSGVLCAYGFDNGWPSIFYLFGGGTLIWLVFWTFFVFDSPNDHPRITAAEREYIKSLTGSHVQEKDFHVPWGKMATSLPLWAIILAHLCNNWCNYTMMTSLPTYMKDVLKFDMKQNGLFSALPYLGMFCASIIGGPTVDWIRSKGFTTTGVRKCVQSIAFFVPAVFIIAASFLNCTQRYLAVAFLVISVTMTSMSRCGYIVNHVDIAPRYAGILFGITNTFATLPGMLAPIAIGQLTQHGTRAEWQIVFSICAGFFVVGGLIYVIFGSGVEQDWAKVATAKEERRRSSTKGPESNEMAPLKTKEAEPVQV
ncbi:sialin-like [Lineus longissimus]|uniref:sialin-like n=1 Tax=Lineus longissimus TaxID=88925 RepID=UPI002B4D5CD2